MAASLIATPVAAADQFDLICEGSVQYHPLKGRVPITERFSFDLTASRYCRTTTVRGETFNEACRSLLDIHEVTPDRIELLEPIEGRYVYIDRQSGRFVHFDRRSLENEEAHCRPADYRPLPTPLF